MPGKRDLLEFDNLDHLLEDIRLHGYYGGIRLVKAAIKKFSDYCRSTKITLPPKNFTIRYETTIPERLGLAGSSAIITGVMKALLQYYRVSIPTPILANLILEAEKDELGIAAGLQDRVTQVYSCPVYMNFSKTLMTKRGYGEYLPFKKELLPDMYIAFRRELAEGSEETHNDLAARYERKDPAVLQAIAQWLHLTEQVWNKLRQGDKNIGALLNRNFDIRRQVCTVSRGNIELVETARAAGASAKLTGSGGAIIGTYENKTTLNRLQAAMKKIRAIVILPEVIDVGYFRHEKPNKKL
ncbi:MAG: hypothetical protein KatS3mg031_0764 [Chitinophagales bacterium]|nr:MAG: hypothetical protein KatS3mg031_0764 [Chitinophagales bacterium]